MGGFLGAKEVLTRERVKAIFRGKEYSYLEEKVTLLEVRDDSLLLRISFLLEYKGRMISIEEKEPIVVAFNDFKVEDWGDGVHKIDRVGKIVELEGALDVLFLQLPLGHFFQTNFCFIGFDQIRHIGRTSNTRNLFCKRRLSPVQN